MVLATAPARDRYRVLSLDELADALRALPEWQVDDGRLVRTVEVPDVWALLERVRAVEAELDHHSVATLEAGHLVLSVWTHVRPGLTAADVALARRIDELLR